MLEDLFLRFQALPAGRHLWVSGVEGRQFLFNCHTAGWGPRLHNHFTWLFNELLKGGGVGANYSTDLLRELPAPTGQVELTFCDTASNFAEEEEPLPAAFAPLPKAARSLRSLTRERVGFSHLRSSSTSLKTVEVRSASTSHTSDQQDLPS